MEEGLEVGGKSCRSRHGCCWGVLRDALLVFMADWCCLTAHHRTDLEKLVLRQAASEPLGVVPIKQTCRTRRWHLIGPVVKGNRAFGRLSRHIQLCPDGQVWLPYEATSRVGKLSQTQIRMSIGNENDQVSKGHLVDALACTGDEGRDTLR
jgi:hypothetical protein